MRDHNMQMPTGELVPVSRFSDADIAEALRDGFDITDADGYSDTTESMMERLRIEVLIRSLGMIIRHYLLGLLHGVALAVLLGSLFFEPLRTWETPPLLPAGGMPIENVHVDRLTRRDVVVHVRPRSDFLYQGKLLEGVEAFSLFDENNREPCEVTIPDDWEIVTGDAGPWSQRAHFLDPDNDDTLAHELLHCVRGAWHQERKAK
jgi:hypothetical protein